MITSLPLTIASLLVLHLDFNTIQMKKDAVVDCLRMASEAGYNAVLWEVENKVRWESCPECVHGEAFSKAEFKEILVEADRLGLEPIPLLQTVGHAEYVLTASPYESWREDRANPACYCTSKPEVRMHLKRIMDEYLELFGPKVRHFHLGGDEALVFGTCSTCRTRNKMDLYVEHLNAVARVLFERGIRPGVWADMMLIAGDWNRRNEVELDEPEIRKLPTAYTLWNWDYGTGYVSDAVCKGRRPRMFAFTGRLQELGYSVIVCGASQSALDTLFLPFYERHRCNLATCAELARTKNLLGCCCTSWSVHLYPKKLQYPLWEFMATRYLKPTATPESDYAAAIRRHFGDVPPQTLDRIGAGGGTFMGFDARQRGYLKPAVPADPGQLENCLKDAKKSGPKTVARRVEQLRGEVASLDAALDEIRGLSEKNEAIRMLTTAVELKKNFVACVADVLEGKPLANLPVDVTESYYRTFQSPLSATNAAALVWSVLAQSGK